jgi:hypothetical protein
MLITVTTAVTLLVFTVSIAISSALVVLLGAVAVTFNRMGLSGQIDSTQRLLYVKTLVYTKSRVAVRSFLFTVRTVNEVIIGPLALLRLTGFLLVFCISSNMDCIKAMPLLPPNFL